MTAKFILVSDDKDFFDYMTGKLSFRGSDEFLFYSFDELVEKFEQHEVAVLIVNSEGAKEKTIEVLKIYSGLPIIIFYFNDDCDFKLKCYKSGMFDYITPLTSDDEVQAKLIPLLAVYDILKKNNRYREILVKQGVVSSNNEVFINYNYIIDSELEKIEFDKKRAVFMAISPNDKEKFLLPVNLLETILLNNIRANDILINYAPNKYFLMLFDIDIFSAQKLWEKISAQFPLPVYAGFCSILSQKREQLINEALNKLHEAINKNINYNNSTNSVLNRFPAGYNNASYSNFKLFRQEFKKKVEQIISPVFFQIQQKYSNNIGGINLQQGSGDTYGTFYIKGKYINSSFRITCPGFSKINIDITLQKKDGNVDAKRITLEPDELEQGILEDLLEQFISEYNKECT